MGKLAKLVADFDKLSFGGQLRVAAELFDKADSEQSVELGITIAQGVLDKIAMLKLVHQVGEHAPHE